MIQLFLEDGHPKKLSARMPSDRDVLLQLSSGLDFIHSKKMVHGEVRPENVHIFTSLNNGPSYVKWSGFGLFKSSLKRPFSPATHKGSMNWMAPELLQLLLDENPSESTMVIDQLLAEIYSAGCTFFFYLTRGLHPFGKNSFSILSNTELFDPVNAKSKHSNNFTQIMTMTIFFFFLLLRFV